MGNPVSVETIDHATLTPVVRKALRSDTVEVTDWECRPVYGGAGMIAGIFRFAGHANSQGSAVPWSVILKSISMTNAHQNPGHFRYGLREVFAYQSGLLGNLPAGLAAPACYGTIQPTEEAYWIWLEDIKEDGEPSWSLDNYGCAARHIGQFNGAYLAGAPLPTYPWLSQNWMRTWVAYQVLRLKESPTFSDHPIHRRVTPPDVAEGMTRLWNDLNHFIDALDRLPQTLCHLDVYRRNLFAQHPTRTVAIDWADMGIGAVGEDPSCLAFTSLLWFEADLADAHELEQIVFAGYLAGLADAGWQGDPRLVRFGYVASAVLRWSFARFSDSVINRGELLAQSLHRPLDEIIDHYSSMRRFLLELADEARTLLPVVG